MARQYSPKSFLRLAPNELIRRYLEECGIRDGINWDALHDTETEPILAAIGAAPDDVRTQVDVDFREIEALADEGGVKTLIEEGRFAKHGIELAPTFANKSPLECSFHTFLEHPQVFEVARRFDIADGLTFEKRGGLPQVEIQRGGEALEYLRTTLSTLYREEQGRGEGCHIDHYIRGERHYYFCYLEDYAENRPVYEGHVFRIARQKPAFDVIIIYDPAERALESKIRGGREWRAGVERVFGRAMLGVDLGEPPDRSVTHDLRALMNRDFDFALEPGDGIERVALRRLKLRIMGRENRRITLEVGATADEKAIWDLLDQLVSRDGIAKELLTPIQAGIRAVFRRSGGQAHARSFMVSYPDSHTLKCDPKDDILKQCLKRWKIDLSGRDDYSPPQPRLDAQHWLWRR